MFRDEGTSLHSLIYSAVDADNLGDEAGQGVMLQASQWWRDLRRSGQVSSSSKLLPPEDWPGQGHPSRVRRGIEGVSASA